VSFETAFLLVLGAFFVVVMIEGWQSWKRTHDETDYLVAGRRMGAWIGGASISATQMSAGTFVGTMGIHYLTGAAFMAGWLGIWVAFVLAAFVIAPRLRRYAHERNALTFPDYIADRFGGKVPRAVVSVLLVLSYVVFMSAQYQAGGVILGTVFGIPFVYGAIILMVLVVGYTVVGGMHAVMRTDFLQQIAMMIGIAVGVPLVVARAGGWEALGAALPAVAPEFTGWAFGWSDLVGFWLGFGFAALCAPYLLLRFYAMPDDRTCQRAAGVALGFVLATGICIAILGMAMRVIYPQLPVPDAASTLLASEVVPPLLGAVVLTAVIAAVMSTVDSVLLVAGPAISHDLYGRLIRPGASEASRMRVNRWATVVLGAVPVLLTVQELDIVQFVVLAYAALLASTIVAPVLLGLYWRRASQAGAVASMLVGFAVCAAWYALGEPYIGAVVPGVTASVVAMILVSLATRPVEAARLEPFFEPLPDPVRPLATTKGTP
jgi:SSS family transporter